VTKTKKIFTFAVVVVILVTGIAGWYAVYSGNNGCRSFGSKVDGPVVAYFSETLQNDFIEKKGGHPIEGFEPFMFMETYPGLQLSDFNCVSAGGGLYIAENGQIVFNLYKSISNRRSSAKRSIISPGMNQLLQNIADRLGRPFPHDEVGVDDIINMLSVYPVTVPTSTSN